MAEPNPLESKLNAFQKLNKESAAITNSISQAGTQILENEMVLKVCHKWHLASVVLCPAPCW